MAVNMETWFSYKGFTLMRDDYDDSDGFVKNWWEIWFEGERHSLFSGFSYTTDGLKEAFQDRVDLIIKSF